MRTVLWVVGPLVAVVVACVGFALFNLLQVERDLRSAEALLQRAGEDVEQGRLADARNGLARATTSLIEANERMHRSASLDAVGWLPVVSDNLESVQRSVGLALAMSAGGDRLLRAAAPLEAADGTLEVPLRSGAIPLDAVAAAQSAAESLVSVLPGAAEEIDEGTLLPSVAELEDRVLAEALERRTQLINLAQGLQLIADMAGSEGPRRYLIAVANTAEMRATGGMILSHGVLESNAGNFELTNFGGIDEVLLQAPAPADAAPVEVSEGDRWGALEPTRLWRNANLVPDFEVVGPRLVAMYEAATGLDADGVIQIDPQGLAAILEGIGPVMVPGLGQVDASNVVEVTLDRAYREFPDDQSQRREVLGDVAEVVFDRLVEGEYPSLRPLGTALLEAVQARHILVYGATRPTAEAARFFEADGELPDPATNDYALLSVQNFSGNKLDYYLDTTLTINGSRPVGEFGSVTAQVAIANTAAPDGQTSYIYGPNIEDIEEGEYRTIVSLYLPLGTNLASFSGGSLGESPVVDTEGGRTVVSYAVTLPAGTSSVMTLDLSLPPRPDVPYSFTAVPVPRLRPTHLDIRIDTGSGEVAGQLALTEVTVLRPEAPETG